MSPSGQKISTQSQRRTSVLGNLIVASMPILAVFAGMAFVEMALEKWRPTAKEGPSLEAVPPKVEVYDIEKEGGING